MRTVFFLTLLSFFLATSCEGSVVDEYRDIAQFPRLAKEHYVDFDVSMKTNEHQNIAQKHISKSMLSAFRRFYNLHNLQTIVPSSELKIPKQFHYIWFGIKLPDEYLPFLQSWLDMHPDWTFLFWVDNPENYDFGYLLEDADFATIQELLAQPESQGGRFVVDVKNLKFSNRIFFDVTKNYGKRSDILRWEVLYRFGGTYIDVDFECFKPFDLFHYTCDFYTGIQPLDTKFVQFGSGLVGAAPHHPILKKCVNTIARDSRHAQIVASTGPLHFMKSFFSVATRTGLTDIVFPASYFYPCGYLQAGRSWKEWKQPESFAIHHWAGSWLKEEGWDRD